MFVKNYGDFVIVRIVTMGLNTVNIVPCTLL